MNISQQLERLSLLEPQLYQPEDKSRYVLPWGNPRRTVSAINADDEDLMHLINCLKLGAIARNWTYECAYTRVDGQLQHEVLIWISSAFTLHFPAGRGWNQYEAIAWLNAYFEADEVAKALATEVA